MEKKTVSNAWQNVAEIEIVYKTKIKPSERPEITSSEDTAELLQATWDKNKIDFIEQFKILLLNRANRVLGLVEISTGGVTGTIADPRIILVAALKAGACGLILSHNHPSGSLKPSERDEHITQKIKEACRLLDISLLDHIIVTSEGYCSFADEGLL